MGKRSKNSIRCIRCRMHVELCLCAHIPRLDLNTHVALIMHHREFDKSTATGPLALEALPNSSLYKHGVQAAPLDLSHLSDGGRRVLLLFPSEASRPLSTDICRADPRQITLVVPDGNWGQAGRIVKRVPGLEQVEHVTLPDFGPTHWGVRHETKEMGLATFEAISRALGIIESSDVQAKLDALFERMVAATFLTRGQTQDVKTAPKNEAVVVLQSTISVQQKPVTATASARGSGDTIAENKADKLVIVFADEHLVAINKPSGLLVHRGWANDAVPALQMLRDQLGRYVYPVHRLDRATSGVLLFALCSEVARDMQQRFANNDVYKRYLALCRGHNPTLQRVDYALAKRPGVEKSPAVTDFRLLGEFERYGLYEAVPHTGRTHQIRRHLKHVSQPIVGDVRYGNGQHNRLFRTRFGFHRLALHCQRMAFIHPRTAGRVQIEAPLSDDFATLLEALHLAHVVKN